MAHQPCREGVHRVAIALHGWAKVRKLARPLVGTVVETPGQYPWVVLGQLLADVEALLEIGRRTGFQHLAAQRLIAAIGLRENLVQRALAGFRLSEESPRLLEHRLLQCGVDTMVGDAEEADLATGRTDAFGHGGALVEIGRKQPGDVDQRQRGGFEMAGAKGFVHGSILLCRPRNGDRRAQYPARRLYSKAENIEHADAVSATAVGAFSRGNRCFAVVRKPACAMSGKGTQSAEIPRPCAPFRCIEGSAGG